MTQPARLGLGLIGIGRPWPSVDGIVPSEEEVRRLLLRAIDEGVTFFDTAPAYGDSERRLGAFLAQLGSDQRDGCTIATKCGEFWDEHGGSRVDHSTTALESSVERSIALLGRIDVLQLHQATEEVLADDRVLTDLVSIAGRHGIRALGASVKSVEACELAARTGAFEYLQMPLNRGVPHLVAWAERHRENVRIIGNRPLASGRMADRQGDSFRFARTTVGSGIVLTGTTKPAHLSENARWWRSSDPYESAPR